MSAEFPTDAERLREAIRAVELWMHPVPMALTDALVERIEPLIRAREAAAWDAGWSARADRPHLKRGEAVPAPSHINPHQGAEDDRD